MQKGLTLNKSPVVIDFDDLRNSNAMMQTFERTRDAMIKRFGAPTNTFDRGFLYPSHRMDKTGRNNQIRHAQKAGQPDKNGTPVRLILPVSYRDIMECGGGAVRGEPASRAALYRNSRKMESLGWPGIKPGTSNQGINLEKSGL